MTQLDDLPEEVLLLVFGYLSTPDLLNNIGAVCRKWQRLTCDYRLYERVLLDDTLPLSSALEAFKGHAKHVQHVELKSRHDLNRILPAVAGCYNLRSLKIVACLGHVRSLYNLNNSVDEKLIEQVMKACPAISAFYVRQTAFHHGLHYLCPDSMRLQILRIKLPKHMSVLDRRLEQITGLQDLQLQGVRLYNDRALVVVILNNAQTLTILKLDILFMSSYAEFHADELMQSIGRCTQLTKLSLRNSSYMPIISMTDCGFAHLANLKRLRSLVMTGVNRVSARAIKLMFYEPHMRHLEKLNLGCCSALHQELRFVVNRCRKLRELHLNQFGLSRPCIDAYDLRYVGARCPLLRHLELGSMDRVVGEALPFILKDYPSLRSFRYMARPVADYGAAYDHIVRMAEQKLGGFSITCSLERGICGRRVDPVPEIGERAAVHRNGKKK